MSLVEHNSTTNAAHHSGHNNTQTNAPSILFGAWIVKQDDLIQERGNGVENSNCERNNLNKTCAIRYSGQERSEREMKKYEAVLMMTHGWVDYGNENLKNLH
jgi:hypothetical protein